MPNILITSAGRRVSLIKAFKKELKRAHLEGYVFTTDLSPELSSACQVADKAFKVGRFTDTDYIDVLFKICINNDIKIVIPTIDTELKLLTVHRLQFEAQGISIIISDESLIQICRNKYLTNDFLRAKNFKLPNIVDINHSNFPVFIKPVDGSSSKNIFLIVDESMLAPFMKDATKFIHMEYLSPKDFYEYTVDLYYNQQSELCCAVPRIRIETRGGEVSKGITRKGNVLDFVKTHLSILEGARGCITLQLFEHKTNGDVYGIEINPRFGGGYPLSYLAGANYPKMIIQEYILNKKINYTEGWKDNLLVIRHDSEITQNDFQYPA
jgi:carbamoyl-phosphate synthase large subunit